MADRQRKRRLYIASLSNMAARQKKRRLCIASLSSESGLILIDLVYHLVGVSIFLSSVIIWWINLIVSLEIPVTVLFSGLFFMSDFPVRFSYSK